MNRNIRIARSLVKLARMLIAFREDEIIKQLKNSRPDLKNDVLIEYVSCILGMNPKHQKAALFWIKNKRLILPEDLDKFNEAMDLIDKNHLDFQKFDAPTLVLQWKLDKENSKLDLSYSPDHEPCFKNKKNLGKGVVIYDVDDSKKGQLAVRKANDACWGVKFGNWCLSRRKNGVGEGHELDDAWKMWKHYSAYPKRIAFQNGMLIGLSAGDEKQRVVWWDKNDESHTEIPVDGVDDDYDFLMKYGKFNIIKNPNTSKETSNNMYMQLAEDEDWRVRENVAENPNTSVDILIKLAKDGDKYVRAGVAQNPNAPADVLKILAKDGDNEVREQARNNPNFVKNRRKQ